MVVLIVATTRSLAYAIADYLPFGISLDVALFAVPLPPLHVVQLIVKTVHQLLLRQNAVLQPSKASAGGGSGLGKAVRREAGEGGRLYAHVLVLVE